MSALATFGLTVVVTRAMSLELAGVFFATSSIVVLISSVGRLGTDTSLVYFLSRCRALGRQEQITSYVGVALRPVIGIGVLTGGALFLGAPAVARWITSSDTGLATTYLRAFAVLLPFASIEYVLLAATRGLGTMRPSAVVEQLIRPALQLLLVAIAVLIPAVGLLPWAWSSAYVLATALALWWWIRLRPASTSASHRVGREFWRFSTPRSLTGAAQVGLQRLDIVLVAALAGVGPAALYTATTRFIVLGQMARNAVSQAVQPPLAEALARHDMKEANRLYQVSTAWLVLSSWPIYLILATAGDPLLQIFGGRYADGAHILLVLSLGMLIAIACGDVDIVLVMAGRPTWSMWNVLLAFGSNVALDLLLIPRYGVMGAAIAWAIAMVIKNGAAMAQVALLMHLHPVGRASIVAVGCTAMSFGIIPMGVGLLPGGAIQQLGLGTGLGALAYAAALWGCRRHLQLSHFTAGAISARRRKHT